MTEPIQVRREGAVEVLAFNNPPLNFISGQMLRQLHGELRRIEADEDVRVLVLTGGMRDSFVTHYDVSELIGYAELGPPPGGRLGARMLGWVFRRMQRNPRFEQRMLRRIEKRPEAEQSVAYWSRCMALLDAFPKPIIAAINGLALGGGCEISLCCDFRYMARGEHYRIGLPEVLVGIIPGSTGTPMRLPRVVGEAVALEMLMTGRLYNPDEAREIGLVHRVFPPDDLMPAVMDLAEQLARGAPVALAAIRRAVREGSRMAFSDARLFDVLVTNTAFYSRDALEAMQRYVELVSRFDEFDIETLLGATSEFREGRAVTFSGR